MFMWIENEINPGQGTDPCPKKGEGLWLKDLKWNYFRDRKKNMKEGTICCGRKWKIWFMNTEEKIILFFWIKKINIVWIYRKRRWRTVGQRCGYCNQSKMVGLYGRYHGDKSWQQPCKYWFENSISSWLIIDIKNNNSKWTYEKECRDFDNFTDFILFFLWFLESFIIYIFLLMW